MKTKFVFVASLCCLMIAMFTGSALAQNARVGTIAAPELLIPVGGRDLALGGSSLATVSGVEALYWNPAGLGRLKFSAEGLFSSMSYIADINVVYGAVGGKFGDFGNVGFSVKSIDVGDIPLTTEDDPEGRTGKMFSPSFIVAGFTYARGLTDAISVGATLKVISESIDRVSASGVALDFGIQYKALIGVTGLNLGVTIKNIGPQMKFDGPGLLRRGIASNGVRPVQFYKSDAASFELPALVEIGLGYESQVGENMVWNVNGAFSNSNLYYDEFRVGGELGYTMDKLRLFGRAGWNGIARAQSDNIFGASFGGGIGYAAPGIDITVDYAYRQVDFFSGNNVLSLKFGF